MKKLTFPLIVFLSLCFSFFSAKSQNLITNGDFESGDGVGFTSNYFVTSGPSVQRNYAVISDPNTINPVFSSSCTDHTTGSGKMMVVDGSVSSGDKIWEQVPGGGIPIIAGRTYTFSYWIQSISSSNNAGNLADILVKINGTTVTPTTGSTVCPAAMCSWAQVTYKWTATTNYAQIWLYDNQTADIGNDFALDDLSLTVDPLPLSLTYSVINPTCPDGTNGYIIVYASGGTPPYSYSINGGSFSSSNIFTDMGSSIENYVTVQDSNSPTAQEVSSDPVIDIVAPTNTLSVRSGTTINVGSSTSLKASGASSYFWTASPTDLSLTTPNIASPTVSPIVTTVYTVTSPVTSSQNLIYNPGFESGNVGFVSDYSYFASTTSQRTYGITTDPSLFDNFFSSLTAHGGSGNMMVVDGSSVNAGNDKVWSQIIPVVLNTNYTFSYWIQTVASPNPAILESQINGLPVTGTITSSTDTASATIGGWKKITHIWNSGSDTVAIITLYDRNTASAGNDFAIDDLSFSTSTTCSLSKSVTITVRQPLPIKLIAFNAKWNDASHKTVLVNWEASSVVNNGHFDVERSTDGIHYFAVGSINITNNNLTDVSYNFTDTDVPDAFNIFYYRLKQVDNDGQIMYSNNVVVRRSATSNNILVFPNPAQDAISLQGTKPLKSFSLFGVDGKLLIKTNEEINSSRHVDLTGLPKGVYVYLIMFTDKTSEKGKLMIK